jgi:kynurenine 3-monooxygenase
MTQEESHKHVGVVGAGLVGCLAALAFAKRGYEVSLFEMRPETEGNRGLRSINLAVSSRGLLALEKVDQGMCERIKKHLVPMHGRMVHDLHGNQLSQNYGLYGESINSIGRWVLNTIMLKEIQHLGSVKVFFQHKLNRIKWGEPSLAEFTTDSGTKTYKLDVIIGADGTHSRVRSQLQRVVPMTFSQEYIDHLYLELYIPPGERGEFQLDPNHLHIWPRHEYMLIALANSDGSFTSTLFAPQTLFDSLDTADKMVEFFQQQFPDALALMGTDHIVDVFQNSPRGSLVCTKCSPYHFRDKCIIIGDAAHSMVPFYGQGMNCGFEDVRILLELVDEYHGNLLSAFSAYTTRRQKDLRAIIDLSMNNYLEMRDKVTSLSYKVRKQLDSMLSRLLGDSWLPLYTMVSFRPDISYSEAVAKESRQTEIVSYAFTGLAVGAVALAAGLVRRYIR